MTLPNVPDYDPDRIGEKAGNAIVIGASMAGLLAARVLVDRFDSVTVIDRDPLPDEPVIRRGVPQGAHPHALLEAGRATIGDLFPGYEAEFVAAGGLVVDAATDFEFYSQGDFLARVRDSMPLYCATRPLFELVARRQLSTIDEITLRAPCQFIEYVVDEDATTVQGVVARSDNGEEIELTADLVVDATGRTTRTPTWLGEHGYTPPRLDEVHIDIAYSTTTVKRPSDDHQFVLVPAAYPETRGGVVYPVENDRWIVNLHGVHGDHPPTTIDDFREFAASLPAQEIHRTLDAHEPLTDEIHHYPFPSNRRYRYAALDRFPAGLLVLGDAVASFNPIYGQGMSVAALEALQLHRLLAEDRNDLALQFFDRVDDIVDIAWSMAVGADFAFPQTEGPKPRGTDLIGWYLSRLTRKAHHDDRLTDALYRVFFMEQPPTSLLRPRMVWRVLSPGT